MKQQKSDLFTRQTPPEVINDALKLQKRMRGCKIAQKHDENLKKMCETIKKLEKNQKKMEKEIKYLKDYCKHLDHRTFGSQVIGGAKF
jgi:hypothetical protein